jgi:uncharacterized membrane protein
MTYDETISHVVQVVEGAGVIVMVLGGAGAFIGAVPVVLNPATRPTAYAQLRRHLGRVILIGLELLIIGDIVRTVIVEPTIESVLVLGLIVVIRIVLSFALEVEIDGRWPWQQGRSTPPEE